MKLMTNLKVLGLATMLLMCSCGKQKPTQGESQLVIKNAELQQYTEGLMSGKTGALVAVVPATGEVLCMVSTLGEHMESFGCDINSYNALGSAFNSAIVLASLQDSIITSETELPCNHCFWKDGCQIMGCHDGVANWPLEDALATSCNGYFGGCRDRFLNSTRYKNQDAASARLRELIKSLGIGEVKGKGTDQIAATPQAMAHFAAIIANRGKCPTSAVDADVQRNKSLIDSVHFETVIRGMRKAAEVGIVWRTGNMDPEGIELCGATGTTLNPEGKNQTAFLGFAPMENPVIAIYCVIEQDDSGSVPSVPVATLVIERYINGHISDRRKYLEDK